MKRKQTILASIALTSPFLIASALVEDSVTFAPKDGTTLTKTYTLAQTMEVTDTSMSVGGTDFPMDMEMTMEVTQITAMTDTFETMGEGKPTKLVRLYKDASMEMAGESETKVPGMPGEDASINGTGTSALKGKKVHFTWDAEKGEYTKKFDEETEGEESHLDGLVEDTDLRGLLPDKAVSEGDEWDAENSVVLELFSPGGNWQWNLEGIEAPGMGGGPDAEMMSDMRMVLGESMEGSVTCRYEGMKEKDGSQYMAIAVEINIDSENDLTEHVNESMEEADIPVPMEVTSVVMSMVLEGKGTLYWDGESGHMYAFDYKGEFEMNMEMAMSIEQGGTQEIEMSMDMDGTMELGVETE